MSSKNKFLILWNESSYAQNLSRLIATDADVATSYAEFQLLAKNISQYRGIVVLAELSWGKGELHELLSRLNGIEFAKRTLRLRLKFRYPILFVSFLSIEYLHPKNAADSSRGISNEIVAAVGHEYDLLPANPRDWINKLSAMESLNDIQFLDISRNLCDAIGLLGEAQHKAENQFRGLTDETDISEIRREFMRYLAEVEQCVGAREAFNHLKNEIVGRFETQVTEMRAPSKVGNLIEEFGASAKRLLTAEVVSDSSQSASATHDWKVLLLDDEPERPIVISICEALQLRGIETVVVSSSERAAQIIDKDWENRFAVCIADYRLTETYSGTTRHQRKQGYDFLIETSRKDRLTSLIALSGLSRRFLLESFHKYGARVAVYSKSDVEMAISLFADFVIDAGNEVSETLCSLPDSASGWKHLRPFYLEYRRSPHYRNWEYEVSERARDYVLALQSCLSSMDDTLLLQPSLPMLVNVKGTLKDKSPGKDPHMALFRTQLVARRIALWCLYNHDFDMVKIYAVLNRSDLNAKDPQMSASAKNLINTRLALKLDDFPLGILVEEKNWFRNTMGANFDDVIELLSQIAYHIQIGIESLARQTPWIVNTLREAHMLSPENRPIVLSFRDGKRILSTIAGKVTSKERDLFLETLNRIHDHVHDDKYAAKYIQQFSDFIETTKNTVLRNP